MTENKHWLKEGDPVVHISNLSFIMTVQELVYKRQEIFCDEKEQNAQFDVNSKKFVRNKKILIGVKCKWMSNEAVNYSSFHSRELIPLSIANKGIEAINKFIESR